MIARRAAQVWPWLLAGAVCMGLTAATTALYALLIGPFVQALFVSPEEAGAVVLRYVPDAVRAWAMGALEGGRWALPAAIVCVAGVRGAAYWGQRAATAVAGERLVAQARHEALEGLLGARVMAARELGVGEVAARLARDAEALRDAVTEGVLIAVRDGLSALVLLGAIVALDAQMAVVALVAAPLVALSLRRYARRLRGLYRARDAQVGALGERAGEALANLEALRVDRAQEATLARLGAAARELAGLGVRATSARAAHSAWMELIGVGGLSCTLLYAAQRIEAGTLQPATFVSLFAALLMLYEPLRGLGRVNGLLQAGRSAHERLDALAQLAPEPTGDAAVATALPVVWDDVRLGYTDAEPRVEGLTGSWEAGDRVALIGPSGSGKTTVVRALLGLIEPLSGRLTFGGTDATAARKASLRAHIAYAGQEVLLFDATVADNLRLAAPEADDARLRHAARLARIDDVIAELPQGWQTRLGPNGWRLSGGQRQRLAIARAVVKDAPVLVLDEALTGLEPDLRDAIMRDLKAHRPDQLVVLVAHDPELQRHASRVVRLDPAPDGAASSAVALG